MKSLDIQILFEVQFKTLDKAGARKYFKTYEIESFLNDAMYDYFSNLVSVFEINEKARKTLIHYTRRAELTKENGTDVPSPINDNSVFYNILLDSSETHPKIVEEQIYNGTKYVNVLPITHDYYQANIKNRYKKPYDDLAWRLDISTNDKSFHEIIYYGNIESYQITFIVKPDMISFEKNTELFLPKNEISNIVKIAVSNAARTINLDINGAAKGK